MTGTTRDVMRLVLYMHLLGPLDPPSNLRLELWAPGSVSP